MAFLDIVSSALPEQINSAHTLKHDMSDQANRAELAHNSEDNRREILGGRDQFEDRNHDHRYSSKNASTTVSDGACKPRSGPKMRSTSAADSSSADTSVEPRKTKMGEYALAMGVASVSRESCENLLTKGGADGEGMGRAITIVIGGARESLDALPHTLRLVLKRRKGFIKLAIRTGADLVPVLAFGENDLYEQVRSEQHPLIHKFQMLIKHTMGFTIPLFHARGVFNYDVGLMPYRRPLNIVVGRPIQVIQQQDREKMDDEYIDYLHAKYMQELERLWEQWKDVYARDRTSELEIVA
ncbi:diacylglycerol O-acyltransferase 1 [Aspergillus hancockii]|nr:diacylglycerol O-acyltransferase 1 [Aspergillus hancockii]